MNIFAGKARIVWFTLAGMVVGYLLMHPLAMLAYILDPQHLHRDLGMSLWVLQLHRAFSPEMLAMGGAFVLMGGVAGFGLGAWYLQKERLAQEKLELQRHQAALETLKELTITLAHYIRNANIVIGGFSARILRRVSDSEIQEQLQLIQQASREIEAVIDSLENLREIRTIPYTAAGRDRMIDLKKELEARLASSPFSEKAHEP